VNTAEKCCVHYCCWTYHLHTDMIMAVTHVYFVLTICLFLFLIRFHVIKAMLHSFIPLTCAECLIPCCSQSFFHSSLLYTLSFHPFPPTGLPSCLISSCHLFLGLPLSLVVSRFLYNTLLEILFSSILFTCPNQRNLRNVTVSVIVGF